MTNVIGSFPILHRYSSKHLCPVSICVRRYELSRDSVLKMDWHHPTCPIWKSLKMNAELSETIDSEVQMFYLKPHLRHCSSHPLEAADPTSRHRQK